MVRFQFPVAERTTTVLCVGAHSDDIEIGCGGTILRILAERPVVVHWNVLSCTGPRKDEAMLSADSFLADAVESHVALYEFEDAFFPYMGEKIKRVFEQLKRELSPDLIFTHARHDLHQDHRVVNELTWNTFRDHQIFEYEIPKYDGDLGMPNLFVGLDPTVADRKIYHIMKHFGSQRSKRWFDEETFRGILRLRGIEAGTRYAEGFYCRKMLF
jgi:LmbE family N-acetylglucosaminyl deacetylase